MLNKDSRTVYRVAEAVDSVAHVAADLFDVLVRGTSDGVGITRTSYGNGEQFAHGELEKLALSMDLNVHRDAAGNLYMTLPGRDRSAPAWFTGSHLDSVPQGGNFDGAAGVVAGIVAVAALQEAGVRPGRDITVMAIRAEECNSWFAGPHEGHLGSRAALGMLSETELHQATRVDTGRSLARHIAEAGFDPELIISERPLLSPACVRGFLEVHIEQGPVLDQREISVGIVTGIRGNLRARNARCTGSYTHSGAVPHELRQDAVMAMAHFVTAVDNEWTNIRSCGGDLVVTFGKFYTDSAVHSLTKVPGEVRFTLDIRSKDEETLAHMRDFILQQSQEIGAKGRVQLELGYLSSAAPAIMDATLRHGLNSQCTALGIDAIDIACGAGHDAVEFCHSNIPTAMILIRNQNGSHNPQEQMRMTDFFSAAKVLASFLTAQE